MCARKLLLLAAALVGTVLADPQTLILKNFRNGITTLVNNTEDGANLYLASNDNADYFKNIQVTTGGATHSLSEILTPSSDGTPQKLTISGGLTVTSTNPDSVTNTLTGYLYLTTAKQAQDPLFKVYVITGTHHLNIIGQQSTTVVLNTQVQTQSQETDIPQKNTLIPGIQQDSNAQLALNFGIPSATYNTDGAVNNFFTNPVQVLLPTKLSYTKFFSNIEPLQIGLDYWYITATGSINMTLQNNYLDSHNITTTAVDTTGVIISSNKVYQEHVVNFKLDPNRGRTIGSYIDTILTRQVSVNFIFIDATGKSVRQTFDNQNPNEVMTDPDFAAQKLVVNATDILPGVFYCQYYGFSNALQSTTTQATPVTQNSPTTQSSSQTTATNQTPAAPGSSTTAAPSGGSTTTGPTNAPGSSTTAPANSPTSPTVMTTTRSSRSLLMTDVLLFFTVICGLFL